MINLEKLFVMKKILVCTEAFFLYLRSKTRIRNRWIEDYDERPWYVVEKKLSENILVVAQGNDNQNYLIKIIC